MKKVFCLILAIVLIATLSACGRYRSETKEYELQITRRIEADWNNDFQNGKRLPLVDMTFDKADQFRSAVKELPEEEQEIIPDINNLFKYDPAMIVELDSGETVWVIHFIAVKFTETDDGKIVISDLARVTNITSATPNTN